LKANGGKFPKFPVNQVMNKQLKKFAKHIGLDDMFEIEEYYFKKDKPVIKEEPLHKKITCHIGRDSFVTNLSRLGVSQSVIEYVSHPERSKTTLQKYYDKSSAIDKAAILLDELERVRKSDIYCL